MRTTLIIDDRLLRTARRRAAELGVSLSEVVNATLREWLTTMPEVQAPPFRMLTFGGRKAKAGHEPEDFARALAAEDAESLGRR